MTRLPRHRLSALFAAALALTAAWPAAALPRASVVARSETIASLGREFAAGAARLRELAAGRAEYFGRGLGWRNPDSYGFQTRSLQVYFTPTYAGFQTFDQSGIETSRFTVGYQGSMPWAQYTRSDGCRLSAGYDGRTVRNLEILFPDGVTTATWDSSFRVSYPGGDASYTLNYQRDEPNLVISPAADAALRSGDRAVLDDLAADLPSPYITRALVAAARAGVPLADDRALARFSIGYFRALCGAPEPAWDPLLEQSASSHARYLVDNRIIRGFLALVPTAPDVNVYLSMHDERAGVPGFTGVSVTERAASAGYRGPTGETANWSWADPVGDVANWFASIFHRRPFMDLRIRDVGYGRAVAAGRPGETAGIANWGYDTQAAKPGYLVFPRDGEQLVPYAWGAVEAPNPFPGRTEGTGPPITVAFADPRYRGGRVELLDAGGKSLPLLRTELLPDPQHFIETIPDRPLKPGAAYTIRFSYGGSVDRTTFSTAPLDPAEMVLRDLRSALAADVDVRPMPFDLEAAMREGSAKGALEQRVSGGSTRVADRKYGFSVTVPKGWSLADRTWQELALASGNATIGFALYAAGPVATIEDVTSNLAKSIQYKLERSEVYVAASVSGVVREYSWQYPGRVVLYALLFGDYALGVYGYGVAPADVAAVVASLRPE